MNHACELPTSTHFHQGSTTDITEKKDNITSIALYRIKHNFLVGVTQAFNIDTNRKAKNCIEPFYTSFYIDNETQDLFILILIRKF